MKRRRLLARLARGDLKNVAFDDMLSLMEGYGFEVVRINGSHHILRRRGIREIINMQNVGGEAKPYQIRQFLRVIERHDLQMRDE